MRQIAKIINILLFFPVRKVFRFLRSLIFVDLRTSISAYDDHDGELSTCAIAFFLLISFIPGSLVIISLLSFFYGSGEIVSLYLNQIKHQLPPINIDELISVIDRIIYSKRYLAFVWIPFLFWWGSLVFDVIERVLEKAFRMAESRKYWRAKIRHFLIIIGIGIMVLILTIASNLMVILQNTSIVNYIQKNLYNIPYVHDVLISIGRIPFIYSSITTLIMNTLLIYIIYKFVPPKKIDRLSLFKGAFFASFSFEVVKLIFSYYITEINDYTSIFGSLSTIVILMIWIWYTCFLFVIGAEMVWVFYEKKECSKELDFFCEEE